MKNQKKNPNFSPKKKEKSAQKIEICKSNRIENTSLKVSMQVKSVFANRLKRALPKFRGDRSEVRGVNGRSKFAVAAVRKVFRAKSIWTRR